MILLNDLYWITRWSHISLSFAYLYVHWSLALHQMISWGRLWSHCVFEPVIVSTYGGRGDSWSPFLSCIIRLSWFIIAVSAHYLRGALWCGDGHPSQLIYHTCGTIPLTYCWWFQSAVLDGLHIYKSMCQIIYELYMLHVGLTLLIIILLITSARWSLLRAHFLLLFFVCVIYFYYFYIIFVYLMSPILGQVL